MRLTIEEADRLMAENNGNLNLRHTLITSLPDGLTVGGYLNLCRTPIASLPDGLTVGGSLDLSGTPVTSLPDGLTVGGYLNLYRTPITSLPDSLAIGRFIWSCPSDKNSVRLLRDGEYVPGRYLYADGILTHVRKKKAIGRYAYYLGKIPGRNVVSDGIHYAHCDDFHDGIADLRFKAAKDQGAGQYKHLTLDSELSTEEMITVYRIITGACRQGTQSFIDRLGDQLKDRYTVREAIGLTEGQFGAETFRQFFAA